MEKAKVDYESILTHQLEKLGAEPKYTPRLIKDIISPFFDNPSTDLDHINDYLSGLGWDDIKIDYRTYELARTFFEMNNIPNERIKLSS
jgi:hypothetical protein